MMKRILMIMLVLLICVSAGMAEGEHKGGRNDGSMNLLNEGIALMNGDGVAQDYDAAMQRFLAADEAGKWSRSWSLSQMQIAGSSASFFPNPLLTDTTLGWKPSSARQES